MNEAAEPEPLTLGFGDADRGKRRDGAHAQRLANAQHRQTRPRAEEQHHEARREDHRQDGTEREYESREGAGEVPGRCLFAWLEPEAQPDAPEVERCSASARPVWLASTRLIASGGPCATMQPPFAPPSGPRSITWSACLTTSR